MAVMTKIRARVVDANGQFRELVQDVDADGVFWIDAVSGMSRTFNGATTITTHFGTAPFCSARTAEQADLILRRIFPTVEFYTA